MNRLFIILVLMLARTSAPAAMGILASNENSTAESYSSSNLIVFKTTVTEATYAFLGLHSTNEISQMALTNPVVVYSLPLARLRNYHLGDDFSTLLEPWSQLIYPVVVSTNLRSSLAFRFIRPGDVLSDIKFGQRKLIRELMATYHSIPPAQVKAGDAPFAVEIPVFDIWLIGYVNVQNQLVLLATVDLPLGPIIINRGQPITEAAMLRLATVAMRYNGLPN